MKKLLNILALFCVSSSTAMSLVACTFTLKTPEYLKKVDSNRLNYEILTFIYNSKVQNKLIDEVVKEANENLTIYTPGIYDVAASKTEGDELLFDFKVYSNYDNVEEIQIGYTEDENITSIELEDINLQIQKVLTTEEIYHSDDDVQKSIIKGLQFVEGISASKINEIENINDLLTLETINENTKKWILNIDYLKTNCLNQNHIIKTEESEISGEFNFKTEDDQLKNFLFAPLTNIIKSDTGTNYLYGILDASNKQLDVNTTSINSLINLLIPNLLSEDNLASKEEFIKVIILEIITLINSHPKQATRITFSYEGFTPVTLTFQVQNWDSYIVDEYKDFTSVTEDDFEVTLKEYKNFKTNSSTDTVIALNAMFNINQKEYWYFSGFKHND